MQYPHTSFNNQPPPRHLLHPRHPVQFPTKVLRNHINRILNPFDIRIADSEVPTPSDMPFRLGIQVLRHDGGEDDEFRFEDIEDAVVGEEEAVGDVGGDPC